MGQGMSELQMLRKTGRAPNGIYSIHVLPASVHNDDQTYVWYDPMSMDNIHTITEEGSFRTNFQNGWWFVKIPVLIGLFIVSLLLPNSVMVVFGYASS